ncbi:fimbrillin family protein [Xylanibacter oryzae]|uniref:fimbrillin family protein n=1 Tax=Xylanibacter oryzae TaxID=185293 RepID=UPI0004B7C195|nr:fimbrillin family protein [Xylanibacter oryzae]
MSRKVKRYKYIDLLCSLYLLLIVYLCICSCTSEYNIFDSGNSQLLNFTVSVPEWKNNDSTSNSKTRATPISGSSFNEASSFNIIADAYDGTKNYSTIIKNESVSFTNNMWQTVAPHYWPGTANNTVNFYAYYPTGISSSITHTVGYAPTLSYTVPDDVASQIDIMTATDNNVSGNTNSSAPLAFNHIFAAVQFSVGSAGMPNGTITAIALNNILCKGTYSLNGTWTQDATSKKSFSQTLSVSTNAGTSITSGATTFMMMPQTLSSDASIIVTYSNGGTLTKNISGTWEAGKAYTYNISKTKSKTFDYTGYIQAYTVPLTGTYKLEVWGAQGGNGGNGGYAYGNIYLTQGNILYFCIGGAGTFNLNGSILSNPLTAGYNGGGYGQCGGGGATHIAMTNRGVLKNYLLYQGEILLVAGGGGGGDNGGLPGTGGGINGSDASVGGSGGTQNTGGAGIGSGSFGQGGNIETTNDDSAGAGGSGWYGGGSSTQPQNCSGGGGSGHLGSSLISGTTGMSSGIRSGNGSATITFVSAN